jgi:Phosphopantetheinyl transferase
MIVYFTEIDFISNSVRENAQMQKNYGAALRDFMIKNVTANISNIEIAVTETGKPYVVGRDDIHFNLSHSGRLAVCALSQKHEIGIDIELIENGNINAESIARRYFTADENEYLQKSNYGLPGFYRMWTRKESFLKCTGEGLGGGLKSINTISGNGGRPFHVRDGNSAQFKFTDYTLKDSFNGEYAVSVCHSVSEDVPAEILRCTIK